MKEEVEKIFKKHEKITKEPWLMFIVVLLFHSNKVTNLEELDNILTRLEKGEIDILKEELGINEQSIGNVEND